MTTPEREIQQEFLEDWVGEGSRRGVWGGGGTEEIQNKMLEGDGIFSKREIQQEVIDEDLIIFDD